MVDRVIVYPGALPQTTDVLNAEKFGMLGLGHGMRMVLGTSTFFDGLECIPTSPTPNLQVHVQVGSIYTQDVTDQAAYGDLGTDNTTIYKQGINATVQDLTITPPATGGFSQVYLVQAILSDVDAGSTVLSYFNASNPSAPYSGPANAGTSNYTKRTCICTIALKAGVAAATGTQATPAPDAGYTGLYAITVANGATQITSGNIATLSTAPIVGATNKLPAIPSSVQAGIWLYATDTGSANVMAAAVTPIPAAPTLGMEVHIKAAATNTGATTFNLNGTGAVAVKRANGAALSAGDINIGMVVGLIFDGSVWQIKNYFGFTSSTVNNNTYTLSIPYAQDTSTSSNSIIVAPNPALTSLSMGATQIIVKLANPIAGPTTIAINALAAVPVISLTGQPLSYGAGIAGEMLWMLYDGANFQIINHTLPQQQNLTIYVSSTIGSDNYDGTQPTVSGTKGPLQHIQTAVDRTASFAPNNYTITIQCAAGTYSEHVGVGPQAGPKLIITGVAGAPSNVLISPPVNYSAISVSGSNTVQVQNLKFMTQPSSSPPAGLETWNSGAYMLVNNTVSGYCAFAVFEAYGPSTIQIQNHTFTGNSSHCLCTIYGGLIDLIANGVLTIANPIICSDFASSNCNGSISVALPGAPVFVNPGYVTGLKFSCTINGIINTQGLGVNYFPGNSAGATSLGGIYA